MDEMNIKLKKEEIPDFIRNTNSFVSDIDIIYGNIILDAKSMLGIYNLDLSKSFKIKINCIDDDELKRFHFVFKFLEDIKK